MFFLFCGFFHLSLCCYFCLWVFFVFSNHSTDIVLGCCYPFLCIWGSRVFCFCSFVPLVYISGSTLVDPLLRYSNFFFLSKGIFSDLDLLPFSYSCLRLFLLRSFVVVSLFGFLITLFFQLAFLRRLCFLLSGFLGLLFLPCIHLRFCLFGHDLSPPSLLGGGISLKLG